MSVSVYRYIYCLSCSFTSADTNVSLLPQLQVFWMPLRPLRGFARLRLFNCKPVSIVKKTVHPLSTMWLLACTTLQGLTCSHYREKLGKPPPTPTATACLSCGLPILPTGAQVYCPHNPTPLVSFPQREPAFPAGLSEQSRPSERPAVGRHGAATSLPFCSLGH